MNISISQNTQKLIQEYQAAEPLAARPPLPTAMSLEKLIGWLKIGLPASPIHSNTAAQKKELLLVRLRTELLHDLSASLSEPMSEEHTKSKSRNAFSYKNAIKFGLLTAAGVLVAACQGFDGIVTMLGLFTLPPLIILGVGCAFSFLSVIVFFGSDLVKISNKLGIKLKEAYKLLDAYELHLHEIKVIRKKIEQCYLSDSHDLIALKEILPVIKNHCTELNKTCKKFKEELQSTPLQIVKALVSGISALLFFGGGFFAGQSVAIFIASLIVNPVIPLFWPVILFSALVGLAALGIYSYVESPGLNKLVSGWFGLNEKTRTKLCDEEAFAKEANKLAYLEKKINKQSPRPLNISPEVDKARERDPTARTRSKSADWTHPNGNSFFTPPKNPMHAGWPNKYSAHPHTPGAL